MEHVVEISFNGRAAAADQKWGLTWDRDDPCMAMSTYTNGADGLLSKIPLFMILDMENQI